MCFRPPTAAKKVICPKCGTANLATAESCGCGEPLPKSPAPGAAPVAPGAHVPPVPGANMPPAPPKAPPAPPKAPMAPPVPPKKPE